MAELPIPHQNKKRHNWRALFCATVLSAYFYALMEWIFFATKPSSLSVLSPFELVRVLFVTGGAVGSFLVIVLILLSIPARLLKHPLWGPRLLAIRYIPLTMMLAVIAMILIDNFTYTVFKFGVISTKGILRGAYALGFTIIFWRLTRFAKRITLKPRKIVSILTVSLFTVSVLSFLSARFIHTSSGYNVDLPRASADLPNIIILGGDGLSASFMSVYGFAEETTPFLTQLAETSLVAENAFANASSTTASTTSALTGKEPIEVGVFRYPDVLQESDAFEHLPGILKKYGYQNVEIGTPYYVDAKRLNLLDGFDIVNNHSLNLPFQNALRKILGDSPSTYFLQTILGRAGERLLHIFFIQEMQNPLAEVNDPHSRLTDEQRVDEIIELLKNTDRPVFVFSHLMDTHGPVFSSQVHVFSSGTNSDEEWDEDLYKDALLSFDDNVKKVYDYLERSGKLDNTILVIYTDHGFRYHVNHRIPVIIRFPKRSHAGTRKNNVEIIDLPVTLLDYLGISKPDWMSGVSMLGDEPPADRRIFSVIGSSPKKIAPPFNQIMAVQMIVCDKWYSLNVQNKVWNSNLVKGHTERCDKALLPSDDQARQMILDYLKTAGYDISSLE